MHSFASDLRGEEQIASTKLILLYLTWKIAADP